MTQPQKAYYVDFASWTIIAPTAEKAWDKAEAMVMAGHGSVVCSVDRKDEDGEILALKDNIECYGILEPKGLTPEQYKDAQEWYDGLDGRLQDSLLSKWIAEYYEQNIIDCEG